MRKFKELKIWQLGMDIVKDIYLLAAKLPNDEKYGLRSQITRAAVSIPSNIAEGSSRYSDKDFNRFLEIALGSLYELQTQLLIIQNLKMMDEDELKLIFDKVEQESKMINGFISKVKNFQANT